MILAGQNGCWTRGLKRGGYRTEEYSNMRIQDTRKQDMMMPDRRLLDRKNAEISLQLQGRRMI